MSQHFLKKFQTCWVVRVNYFTYLFCVLVIGSSNLFRHLDMEMKTDGNQFSLQINETCKMNNSTIT